MIYMVPEMVLLTVRALLGAAKDIGWFYSNVLCLNGNRIYIYNDYSNHTTQLALVQNSLLFKPHIAVLWLFLKCPIGHCEKTH